VTTRELGITLHEELDRREKLIAVLEDECGAIRKTLEIVERGGSTPEAQNRVTRVIGRRGKGKKVQPDGGGIGAAAAGASSAAPVSRVTSGAAMAGRLLPRRTTDNAMKCQTCGAEDFPTKAAVSNHARNCDGVLRTPAERKKLAMDRWLGKKGKTTLRGTGRPRKEIRAIEPEGEDPESEDPAAEDDSDDFDEEIPPAAAAVRETRMSLPMKKPESTPSPTQYWVPCLTCGEKFPDSKSLGIHQTRVHFSGEPAMSRRQGA